MDKKKINNSTLRWLWKVPGKKKLNILSLIAVQALHGASGVLYALLLREIVDTATGHDSAGFWRNLAFMVGLVAGQLALRAIIRWLAELSRSTLENTFKGRLMDTLLHRDYLRVNAVHSGEWINRLTNDAKVVADSYVDILPGLAGMVVKLISALIMIIVLEPRFAAILIPGGLVMMFFTWLFRRRLKTLHKRIQESDGQLRIFLQEHIGNLLMIRSFAAEEQTLQKTEQKMALHQAARMRRNRFSNLANIGFGAAMNGMYLLGVGWCGYGILMGTISFGTLTAITQLITQIQTPFANITGYLPRYYAMLASAERLMEAESFDADTEDAKSSDELKEFYKNRLASIGLQDVSFTYYPAAEGAGEVSKDNMPVVLEHLTLQIEKGETLAFTGHSGCGKSTVLKLLMCVYQPDSGKRYYLDQNGAYGDLTSAWHRLFAYVPQGNALMNGSIREVVSFADPRAADSITAELTAADPADVRNPHEEERLKAALQMACADGFVSDLSDGVDTILGERGTGLSEGQMQRLAIARAIYADAPILLLDESTSALDEQTERKLLENLRQLTDKTVVIITHRKAALSICDRILRFTEFGLEETRPGKRI